MEIYRRNPAKGVTEAEARQDIGRARAGDSIFVEPAYCGWDGQIIVVARGTKEAARWEKLSLLGRAFCLARI